MQMTGEHWMEWQVVVDAEETRALNVLNMACRSAAFWLSLPAICTEVAKWVQTVSQRSESQITLKRR